MGVEAVEMRWNEWRNHADKCARCKPLWRAMRPGEPGFSVLPWHDAACGDGQNALGAWEHAVGEMTMERREAR